MKRPFYDPRSGWRGGLTCGFLVALAFVVYTQSGVTF